MIKKEIQFLSKTRILGYGTTQMRCVQPASYLEQKGWRTCVGCIYRSLPKAEKAIVFHRALLDPHTDQFLRYANNKALVSIYDIDDLLFTDESANHLLTLGNEGGASALSTAGNYRHAMQRCNVVLASTNYLKKRAEHFHPDVRLVKNGISAELEKFSRSLLPQGKRAKNEIVTIAYLSGSRHHDQDFALVEQPLIDILKTYSNTRLLLMGKINVPHKFAEFGNRFEFREFCPNNKFWQVFREIDINIVPLNIGSPFAQARSELKYTEAGIFGIPTIASPTDTYKEVISNNVNGLLADGLDWFEALRLLVTDASRRAHIGSAARDHVLKHYRSEIRAEQLSRMMSDILKSHQGKEPHGEKYLPGRLYSLWLTRMLKIGKRKLTSDRLH